MASLGHPVVGDKLYGAPAELKGRAKSTPVDPISLPRNFLHSAELELTHPRTGRKDRASKGPLPAELAGIPGAP